MRRTLVQLASRNTLRHRARTGLTAGMVTLGVALLIIAISWIDGIFGQMIGESTAVSGHVRVVDPGFAAREELMPLYDNLPDTAALVEAVSQVPGVVAVEPRIATGVTVTAGEEIGEVFALAVGASERYFREEVGAQEKVAQGTWFTGADDEVVVGAKVAERLSVVPGQEILMLGQTQDGALSPIQGRVVGITRGGNAVMDQQIFLPLARMQWLTDIPDGALEILVFGEDYRDAPALAARVAQVPALADLTVQAWTTREPWASMTETVRSMRSFIVFFIVLLAALGIWNTMMMSVLERTHEIGVLRAMGLTRLGTLGLFVGEALAIAVVGGLLGLALGAIPAGLLEHYGVHLGSNVAENLDSQLMFAETMYADLDLHTLLVGFALGLTMAVLGSLIPALRAASIQPVAAMRSRR